MEISNFVVIAVVGIYSVLSKILFDKVYRKSHLIVDEEFHFPLGEQYCFFQFDKWDPKVTTLPGLYLISAIILGPFGLCKLYNLRFISLIFSCINLFLFYILFSCNTKKQWQRILSAITMVLLPPLYFLSHIYYTDMVSLTSILLVIILSEKGFHYLSSLAGFLSILCRQTNVVFLGIYATKYVLCELYNGWVKKKNHLKKDGKLPAKHFQKFVWDMAANPRRILSTMSNRFWLNFSCYLSVLIFFIAFVIINGSIVVGDKEAHQLSINIPQIFYFSLFCLIFGWPYFAGEVFNFLFFAKRHKLLITLSILISVLVIYFNTVVHPYLLADNRHFIFYVWNRFYGKYWWFRYSMVPVYIFSLYVIIKLVWDKKDISFSLVFFPAVTLLLIFQSLIEVRYFLVPYLIIRLRIQNKDSAVFNVVLELITYFVINMITFNIFFTKTLHWDGMRHVQRIIW